MAEAIGPSMSACLVSGSGNQRLVKAALAGRAAFVSLLIGQRMTDDGRQESLLSSVIGAPSSEPGL